MFNDRNEVIPAGIEEAAWFRLKAAAASHGAESVCTHCGSEKVSWRELQYEQPHGEPMAEAGWYCRHCGMLEEELGERNDFADALLLLEVKEAWWRQDSRTPELALRHVAALAAYAAGLEARLAELEPKPALAMAVMERRVS